MVTMFRRRHLEKSRRDYERQPAPEYLFERRPYELQCADRTPGRHEVDGRETRNVIVAGNQAPYLRTRLDELQLSRADVPALTVTVDPSNTVSVTGSGRTDWSLRFCAQGEGQTEAEARESLRQISMSRTGAIVSIDGPRLFSESAPKARGVLVIDAPADLPLIIHASYAAVEVRDMAGPVRIAAAHGRATILNTTGSVDAVAFVIDFAGSRGRVILSAEAEVNLRFCTPRFDGTLLGSAQRSIRTLVPAGFLTPFRAVVNRPGDFVCRADFCSRVVREKKGPAYYFTYRLDDSVPPGAAMQ